MWAAKNSTKKPSNISFSGFKANTATNEMREIASHVKYVLMAGDVVDGVGVYPGQAKELAIKDIYTAIRALSKLHQKNSRVH